MLRDASSWAEQPRTCILIPVYEHARPLEALWPALTALGLPLVLVDDGSGPACASALEGLRDQGPPSRTRLLRRSRNGGKGAAVKDGLRLAAGLGYSHALQVDSDGQFDVGALPAFLAASSLEPGAAICGSPVFGPDAPAARRRWRRLTNFWLAVNTLSRSIPDGMCGLRVYPLAQALPFLDQTGDRMDFDPEILVRLAWHGVPLRFLPVAVRYPPGGTSGFRMFEDNVRITWMHIRLFFGMLRRLPRLLAARLR